jgi:hypothetical protein
LFRLVNEFRPTLLLDEMEGLSGDDARYIRAILNSGYKAGGTVPRLRGGADETRGAVRHIRSVGPGGDRSLNTVMEDRAIPITMQRGSDAGKLNAEVDPADPLYGRIRSGGYRLLLERWRMVHWPTRPRPGHRSTESPELRT